jgi:4-oxalocrotonate tautomerase
MPLARIDLNEEKTAEYVCAVSDVVYKSMQHTLNAPKDDRFQVLARHARGGVIADPTYLGIRRTDDCVSVQVFLLPGRSVEQKKAFYKAVADGLHARVAIRREDVFIGLVEVPKENWSFGNGEAQYA